MAVTKVNAEDWTVEIDLDGVPTWQSIGGIEDFDVSTSTTRADTTDFDSGGAEENRVIRRGRTITLNGHWLEDEATGARDAGQSAVEDAARQVGTAAEKAFRMTSPGGTVYGFSATIQEGQSGDKNDVTKFSYELVRTGPTTVT